MSATATWTGRADHRSVSKEVQARTAALAAQDNFELLRRMTARLEKIVPPVAVDLMKKGLASLQGQGGAALDAVKVKPVVAQAPVVKDGTLVVAEKRPDTLPGAKRDTSIKNTMS